MPKLTLLLMTIFSMLGSSLVLGGTTEYKCTVETEINTKNKSFIENSVFTGELFTVNRVTGLIKGELVSDKGYDKSIVLHPGDSKNGFKVISYAYLDLPETKANIQYLYINSYDKTDKKAFLYHNGLFLLTGYCL